MRKNSVMTLRIPPVLKHQIEITAAEQGISENQLALYMITKELVELESNKALFNYWKGKTKKEIELNFDRVLAKISKLNSNNAIPDWDELDS
jgi:hypothetical protein